MKFFQQVTVEISPELLEYIKHLRKMRLPKRFRISEILPFLIKESVFRTEVASLQTQHGDFWISTGGKT